MEEGQESIELELLRALELFDALVHDLGDIAAESDIDRARLKRVIARQQKESATQQRENAKLKRDLVAAKQRREGAQQGAR